MDWPPESLSPQSDFQINAQLEKTDLEESSAICRDADYRTIHKFLGKFIRYVCTSIHEARTLFDYIERTKFVELSLSIYFYLSVNINQEENLYLMIYVAMYSICFASYNLKLKHTFGECTQVFKIKYAQFRTLNQKIFPFETTEKNNKMVANLLRGYMGFKKNCPISMELSIYVQKLINDRIFSDNNFLLINELLLNLMSRNYYVLNRRDLVLAAIHLVYHMADEEAKLTQDFSYFWQFDSHIWDMMLYESFKCRYANLPTKNVEILLKKSLDKTSSTI